MQSEHVGDKFNTGYTAAVKTNKEVKKTKNKKLKPVQTQQLSIFTTFDLTLRRCDEIY